MKKATTGGIGLAVALAVLCVSGVAMAGSTKDIEKTTAGMERALVEKSGETAEQSGQETEKETETETTDAGETEETSPAIKENKKEDYKVIAGAAEVLETVAKPDEGAAEKSAEELQKEEASEKAAEEDLWGYTNLGIAQVDNHLNVRDKAGEDGSLVGKMTKNAACEILSVNGEWAHIKSGKVEGYVHTDYLLMDDMAKKKAEEVAYTVATVTTETLKVREQPSTDCPVITLVAQEERLEVVEQKPEGWVKIMLDDEEAYVSADYVVVDQELETAVTMKELLYGGGISNTRIDLCQYAKQFVGNPYVWGGTSLTNGADCSGFVQSVFKKFGVSLPRSSREQVNVGTKVSLADAQPGDLIFYAKGGTINHVALYIGNGQVVHASSPKTGIKISNATYRTPTAVKRVLS